MPGGLGTSRFEALDGLRGWAALSVVIYHCFSRTFGVIYPEFNSAPVSLFGNGIMAVGVFLVISGYVLSIRRWHNPANPPLIVSFARRYLRLTIPIIAAVMLVWLLMTLGLTPTGAAHKVTHMPQWYGSFVRFDADFLGAWWFALSGVYGLPTEHNYNPFLWTMVIELWGSLVLFVLSQHDRYLRERYSALLLCMVLCYLRFPLAAAFVVGALIALAERDGLVLPSTRRTSRVATGVLVLALIVGTWVQVVSNDVAGLTYVAVIVFLAVRYSQPAQRFFNLPLSQLLGRISFPLYLVQFPVIISFGAIVIRWCKSEGLLNLWTAFGIATASVALSLAVALLFLPVETATLALLRRLDRLQLRPRLPVPAASKA